MDIFFQAVFACTVALAAAAYNGPLAGGVPASLYPAGVSPQACPNYPNCANPAVAANPAAAAPYNAAPYAGYNSAPAYNPAPQYNAAPAYNGGYNQNALDSGEYTGDGDYHGEGLAESGAYGQQGNHLTLPPFFLYIVTLICFCSLQQRSQLQPSASLQPSARLQPSPICTQLRSTRRPSTSWSRSRLLPQLPLLPLSQARQPADKLLLCILYKQEYSNVLFENTFM